MSPSPPRARLQRGDERIEVAIVPAGFAPGKHEVIVYAWPSHAILERIEAGKMRGARQRFEELVRARTAAGFVAAADPWVLPPAPPEPPVVDPLGPAERRVAPQELRAHVPALFHDVVDLHAVD
jgi:hypothetical protein